jgi:hypothetical protein
MSVFMLLGGIIPDFNTLAILLVRQAAFEIVMAVDRVR